MTQLLALVLAALAIAGSVWGYGEHKHTVGHTEGVTETTAIYETRLDAQKQEAAFALAQEQAKTLHFENELHDFKNKQELKDAEHQKKVAGMAEQLRRAAGPAGRLRDPNAQAGAGRGCSGDSPKAEAAAAPDRRADNPAETGGLFSAGATELLKRLTGEADEVNAAYASCRADALQLRMTLQ